LEPSKSIHFNNFTFYLHSVGIEIRIRTKTVLVQMDAFNTIPNRLQSHLPLPMVVKYDQEGTFSVSLVGARHIFHDSAPPSDALLVESSLLTVGSPLLCVGLVA
jgi:hypothetical protein